MVTLEAVNAMNKQVSDLADKLEQLTHRAVTITVENNHDFWALRGLQYYNENGECVDTPNPEIGPSKVAAAAFSSTLMKTLESQVGTKGMISYEIDSPTHTNDPSLFLLLAWDVSIVAGNFFAIDVISMPHTFLKNRDLAEKKAVCDYLLRDRKIEAGEDTPLLHIEPPNVRFTRRYTAPAPGTPAKDPAFSVTANMNTMSVAKLSVFLYTSHKRDDEAPYTIKSLDMMALRNVMEEAVGGKDHPVRNDSSNSGFMAALADFSFKVKEKIPAFTDGFDVFERVNKLRNKLMDISEAGVTLGIVNHTAAWELVDAISHVDTGYSVHAPPLRIESQKNKFGACSFATTLTKSQPLSSSASRGLVAYTFTSFKWHSLWPVTLLVAWELVPQEFTTSDGTRRITSTNRFAVHVMELRHPLQALTSSRRRRQTYRALMRHYALPAGRMYVTHVGVAVVRSASKNMLTKARNCFSVYASMATSPIATIKVDVCPLQVTKEVAGTPEVWAWVDQAGIVEGGDEGIASEEEDERAIARSWDAPEVHLVKGGACNLLWGEFGLEVSGATM